MVTVQILNSNDPQVNASIAHWWRHARPNSQARTLGDRNGLVYSSHKRLNQAIATFRLENPEAGFTLRIKDSDATFGPNPYDFQMLACDKNALDAAIREDLFFLGIPAHHPQVGGDDHELWVRKQYAARVAKLMRSLPEG